VTNVEPTISVLGTRHRLRNDEICLSDPDFKTIDMKGKVEISGSFLNVFSER